MSDLMKKSCAVLTYVAVLDAVADATHEHVRGVIHYPALVMVNCAAAREVLARGQADPIAAVQDNPSVPIPGDLRVDNPAPLPA